MHLISSQICENSILSKKNDIVKNSSRKLNYMNPSHCVLQIHSYQIYKEIYLGDYFICFSGVKKIVIELDLRHEI